MSNKRGSKLLSSLLAGACVLAAAVEPAQAASVLDVNLTTAMTAGFTDMKDTVAAVIAVAFPVTVGITALIGGVRLVIHMLGRAPTGRA